MLSNRNVSTKKSVAQLEININIYININIRRGVIQGDIPSPVCFLVALDKLLKDHGNLQSGLRVSDGLLLSELEFTDDAAVGDYPL